MTTIPPNIVGPILQSALQQRQIARERDGDANRQIEAARVGASVAERTQLEVEATDDDTRVHADGGGQGSQGRPFRGEQEVEAASAEQEETTPGLHTDERGQIHLALQA